MALANGANVSFDGVDVITGPGVGPEEATALQEAWRAARPDLLPAPLDEAARRRWASLELGLTAKNLTRWLEDLDDITKHRAEWDASGRLPEEFIFEYAFTAKWVPALCRAFRAMPPPVSLRRVPPPAPLRRCLPPGPRCHVGKARRSD